MSTKHEKERESENQGCIGERALTYTPSKKPKSQCILSSF